jgi:acyl-homoserine-lactone acylase
MRIRTLLLVLAAACAACVSTGRDGRAEPRELRARDVTITRDDWGIAHVVGNTDADAVFGLMYAQAEDDFARIETNYLSALGRLAEAEGETAIYRDLRQRLFIDPKDLQRKYATSPHWLQTLMDAWADGLNYYLATHPAVAPKVITHFEPWMTLAFSEGSIGGDIAHISLSELEAFYGGGSAQVARPSALPAERTERLQAPDALMASAYAGSNGIAIAPTKSASGHALLWINPHTSFYFRAEAQATSREGLNVYGAITWGQFFVYQGFNEDCGWMHTTSNVDNIDEYLETVERRGDAYYYRYGAEEHPVAARRVSIAYRAGAGIAHRVFTIYRSHHGPIVRSVDGRWISVRLMEAPVAALTQSWLRTKATGYASFREAMELHANSSNNTVFADADGNIAYFHANFVPRRDTRFDWTRPVDGSDPATEWRPAHTIDESPNVLNPSVGWVYNSNNWPYSAAGPDSPARTNYPSYMDSGAENSRGVHAMRVLTEGTNFTLDTLRAAAFDSYLPAFAALVPPLVAAYDELPPSDPLVAKLEKQIGLLRGWDFRSSVSSIPTTLAVFWGDELWRRARADPDREDLAVYEEIGARLSERQKLEALAAASDGLTADFGTWRMPWGDVNRFQRLDGEIVAHFDDGAPGTPVGFTSSRWGSLAAFEYAPRHPTA